LITPLDRLDHALQDEVLSLIASATDFDGVPPVAEHVLLHLRHGGDKQDSHLIVRRSSELAGYAHLDLTDQVEGPSAEIVVSPKFRRTGVGNELVSAVKRIAGARLRLWSHGDLPGAKNLAIKNGLSKARTVIQMRRSLTDSIPESSTDFVIRNFLEGLDNEAWVAANNRAFAGHPEQSNWTLRDLEIRCREGWFDPSGFLIAELDGQIAGFCWTKIHGGHSHRHTKNEPEHDHDPIGEIYIMGVDPRFQGKGIGRAITIAGLRQLRYQGIFSAMLYVDEENLNAIKLYQSLGFTEWGRDVLYRYNLG
jgi:mycothiol synthase